MIKIENIVTPSAEQWKAIIMGCRNPLNSWRKSDSDYRPILCARCDDCTSYQSENWDDCDSCEVSLQNEAHDGLIIGPNGYQLMKRLRNAGTDHRKFMRMITVYVDITAPLYWWKEFDTYKVGTVANSCSTMHKIHAKEFTLEDFSFENIPDGYDWFLNEGSLIDDILTCLNDGRRRYLECQEKLKRTDLTEAERKHISAQKKAFWWQMIQLLPSSYNQKRTVLLNYEVLANIYKSRKAHKLNEWRDPCAWIETLPYHELITGEFEETKGGN